MSVVPGFATTPYVYRYASMCAHGMIRSVFFLAYLRLPRPKDPQIYWFPHRISSG
ncbi:hypothetical protein BDM02DRAFT_3124215 [Thelephora ganbajun]|uniref:Uncharacterized protein n=1 Tax=Thelephora ganbajun TaxID=370292 RepID=A0ACB6YZP8_THEGA|nr:hypothetical protein BDM02DRAFT_3124215 [Thelephora ganbajun]